MTGITEKTLIKIEGHVFIYDMETNECILNKRNAINNEAMSYAIVKSLASGSSIGVEKMVFGNGGVTVDSLGTLVYKSTNTQTLSEMLYNQIYEITIANDPTENVSNNIASNHEIGNNYSDIIVTATLNYNEPVGQDATDDIEEITGDFIFNEIGLKDSEDNLITHIIFHPVLKSANRKIQIIYTIRIMVGA